jgi:hypothetical protein
MADTGAHQLRPCTTCPYRRDALIGHWSPDEFVDLLKSERSQFGTVYACHGHIELPPAKRGMCAGWLLDQRRRRYPSIKLRMLLSSSDQALSAAKAVTEGGCELYDSVEEMCAANGVEA